MRQFGVIQSAIWDADSDFTNLSPIAQHLYLMLTTQRSTGVSGLGDWRPKRLVGKARDYKLVHIERAATELEAARFVFFDADTDEFLVRTFVRHDGVLGSWKLANGVLNQYRNCASTRLRQALLIEMRKLREDRPDLAAWSHPSAGPKLAETLEIPMPTGGPSKPSRKAIRKAIESPTDRASNNPVTQQPSNNPSSSRPDGRSVSESDPPLFDAFWSHYPRKTAKAAARKAYAKALRSVGADVIVAAAQRLAADPNLPEPQFIPYPTKWLNQGQWEDGPLPARDRKLSIVPDPVGIPIGMEWAVPR